MLYMNNARALCMQKKENVFSVTENKPIRYIAGALVVGTVKLLIFSGLLIVTLLFLSILIACTLCGHDKLQDTCSCVFIIFLTYFYHCVYITHSPGKVVSFPLFYINDSSFDCYYKLQIGCICSLLSFVRWFLWHILNSVWLFLSD